MSGSYPVGSLLRCYFTGRNVSFPSGNWTGTALVDSGSGIFTGATGFNFSTDKNRVVIMQRVD